MKRFLLVVAAACGHEAAPANGPVHAAVSHEARAWDLNDVSLLLPFPQQADLPRMLQATSKGARGALLAKTWLDSIPNPFVINIQHAIAIQQLRAIAIRIDPCVKSKPGAACRYMVRMSWQPFAEANGKLAAVDAAVHSFYELSAADFGALAGRLWALRQPVTAGKPLDIHPVIAAEGLGGPYWTAVKDALLAYCGEQSMTRLTVMQLGGRTNVWVFSGVEKDKQGKLAPLPIGRIDSTVQTIAVHAQPPFQFDGGLFKTEVAPTDHLEPIAQPELNAFLRDSRTFDRGTAVKIVDTLRFLEVPAADSTSDSVDCASCHIAQAARVWLGKYMPAAQATRPAFTNAGGFNLSNVSKLTGLTNQLRAFGYIYQSPVISQRVINESAVVALEMRDLAR